MLHSHYTHWCPHAHYIHTLHTQIHMHSTHVEHAHVCTHKHPCTHTCIPPHPHTLHLTYPHVCLYMHKYMCICLPVKKPWYSKYCMHYSYALMWEMSVDCRSCTILFLSLFSENNLRGHPNVSVLCVRWNNTVWCEFTISGIVISRSCFTFLPSRYLRYLSQKSPVISCWCIFFRRYITTCFLHPKCVSFLVFYNIVSLVQIGKSTHPLHSLTWVTLIFWADSCELLCNIAFLLLSYQKRKAVKKERKKKERHFEAGLTSLLQCLWMRIYVKSHSVIVDNFYIELFSTLKQTHRALVTHGSEWVTSFLKGQVQG